MKNIVYLRVSTDQQDFSQQKRTVDIYCEQNGIIPDMTFTEKESGSVKYDERVLIDAINAAKKGDRLIVSESSRLSRGGFREMLRIIDKCREIGCFIHCVKEGLTYGLDSSEDSNAEMVSIISLAVTSEQSKAERNNLRARTKSGLAVRKDEIERNGFFIAKRSKRVVEKLGDPDPIRLAESALKANIASCAARKQRKQKDVRFIQSAQLAVLLKSGGMRNGDIADRLNETGYKTSLGFDFLPSTVSRLIKDAGKLLNNI